MPSDLTRLRVLPRAKVTHNGRRVRPGEEFETNPATAERLIDEGHAVEAPPLRWWQLWRL